MGIEQEYCIFVFIRVIGVVQLSASYGNIRYLLIFENRSLSSLFGMLIVLTSFIWFFRNGPLHIPDTEGGLAGLQQFLAFISCALLSILFTYLATSLYRYNRFLSNQHYSGIWSMKNTTFLNILFNNIGVIWKRYLK